ncbi:LGFP repeat-containing protein [Pseudarthrobacter sp. N5]|uniref:LGFP repeat-containing protein n=1 Tax=Pseudarthrobacter sp. N5 TaxID=3418416 RepID=UPI003CF2BAA8
MTNEAPVLGGVIQDFQAGQFYWSPDGGSRFVTGGIKSKGEGAGAYTGLLGFPTSNELYGFRAGGVRQTFQGGAITWSPFAGSHITFGSINWLWTQLGRESGPWGYPLADEYPVQGGSSQNFENGVVTWTPQATTVSYS